MDEWNELKARPRAGNMLRKPLIRVTNPHRQRYLQRPQWWTPEVPYQSVSTLSERDVVTLCDGFCVYYRFMEVCEASQTPPIELRDSFWDSYTTQPGVKLMVHTVIQARSAEMSRRHILEDIRFLLLAKQAALDRAKQSNDQRKVTVNRLSDQVTRLEQELAQVRAEKETLASKIVELEALTEHLEVENQKLWRKVDRKQADVSGKRKGVDTTTTGGGEDGASATTVCSQAGSGNVVTSSGPPAPVSNPIPSTSGAGPSSFSSRKRSHEGGDSSAPRPKRRHQWDGDPGSTGGPT